MRTAKDGIVYSTWRSKKLGEFTSHYHKSEYEWFKETLYRTKDGFFFLLGKGGPCSPYYGYGEAGTACSGKRIVPLTEEAAGRWGNERRVPIRESIHGL